MDDWQNIDKYFLMLSQPYQFVFIKMKSSKDILV